MRGDELPSWPTLLTMMAAAATGAFICVARLFGKMQPACASCGTTELHGKFIVAGHRSCARCFGRLRVV